MSRVATALLLAGLGGCAVASHPAGHDYAQAALAQFILNETTVDDAEAVLGPPVSRGTMRGLAKPTATIVAPGTVLDITTLKYYFAPNGSGTPASSHPFKSALLIFVAGHLTGYGISNNIPAEVHPPVDEGRLAALHQGRTSRAEAIALLGPPEGQFINVFGPATGTTTVLYDWSRTQGDTVTVRSLKVIFDGSDRMTSYAVLDNSFPKGGVPLMMPGPQAAPPVPAPPRAHPHPDLEHT